MVSEKGKETLNLTSLNHFISLRSTEKLKLSGFCKKCVYLMLGNCKTIQFLLKKFKIINSLTVCNFLSFWLKVKGRKNRITAELNGYCLLPILFVTLVGFFFVCFM